MESKYCPKCGETKSVDQFNKKGNGLQPYCRPCDNAYRREWYQKDKTKVKTYKDRRRIKTRGSLRELKEGKPCADCGVVYPWYVMDFDHLSDKHFALSRARDVSWAKVLEEVAKCDLVCANCHRERTWQRQQT